VECLRTIQATRSKAKWWFMGQRSNHLGDLLSSNDMYDLLTSNMMLMIFFSLFFSLFLDFHTRPSKILKHPFNLFMFKIWSIFFLLPFVLFKKIYFFFIFIPLQFFHLSYVVFILLITICYI